MIALSQWFLSSSVLILVVLVLRTVFAKKLSLRIRYALWAVVLVRLLLPSSPLTNDLSLSSISQPIQAQVEDKMLYAIPTQTYYGDYSVGDTPEFSRREVSFLWSGFGTGSPNLQVDLSSGGSVTYNDRITHYLFMMPAHELISLLWKLGILAVSLWMLRRNVSFSRLLRGNRTSFSVESSPIPVYLVSSELPTPCLFGLFQPAVYLTKEAVGNQTTLRHVLAHELTHYTHKDHIWSFLRCVCLALHWYNPLVWIAAILSKRDGELACDEGAVIRLGEEERVNYGRTLVNMVARRSQRPGDLLTCSTAMAEGKKPIQRRIQLLVNRPKTKMTALCAAIVIAALSGIFVFSQGTSPDTSTVSQPPSSTQEIVPLTQEELDFFNTGDFFDHGDRTNGEGRMNIRNQFLSSFYDDPRDIDLFDLFYCGTGTSERSMEETQTIMAGILSSIPSPPDCGCTTVTTAEMDGVLTEHMGITLEETNKVGLEYMDYLPEYDVYYYFHGDTNYGHMIHFTSGQRIGNTIQLYYQDTFGLLGFIPCVLTLRQEGDHYYFYSNQPMFDDPAIALSVPNTGDPSMDAQTFADELRTRYIFLNEHHPRSVTHVKLLSAEVFDQSDTTLCATISLAVQPVEPNSDHWTAGAGIDYIEDGPYSGYWNFTLDYRLESQADGTWLCTQAGDSLRAS